MNLTHALIMMKTAVLCLHLSFLSLSQNNLKAPQHRLFHALYAMCARCTNGRLCAIYLTANPLLHAALTGHNLSFSRQQTPTGAAQNEPLGRAAPVGVAQK